MESSILYLVAGFFSGTLVSALLFFLITNLSKKKQAVAFEERNQIIRSIAEIFTEIDALVTSFRTGLISEDKFRNSLNSKLDAANKIFKPNMHVLDLYYVKFAESQFAKYSQFVHGKMTNFQLDVQSAFDSEINVNSSAQSLPEISKSESDSSESAVDFFSDNPVNMSFAEFSVDAKSESSVLSQEDAKPDNDDPAKEIVETVKNSAQANASSDDPFVMINESNNDDYDPEFAVDSKESVEVQIISDTADNRIPDIEFSSVGSNEKPVLIDEEPVIIDEEPFVIDEKPVIIEEKPVVINEEPTVIVEEPSAVEGVLDSSSEINADEIIFEVGEEVVDKKKEILASDTSIEINKKADAINADGSAVSNPEEQKSSFQKEFELVTKEPHDEDLMETIMDLDMGKFLRTGSINIENIGKNSLPSKYASNVRDSEGIEKNKTTGNSLKISKTDESAVIPQKTVTSSANELAGHEKIVVARGDEDNSNTTLDDMAANFELSSKSDDLKDVAITGDDVASKIDSFFGIK